MDVSFILSDDELFTLLSVSEEKSEAGQIFLEKALDGAKLCDLKGLVEKNLARFIDDELELESVIGMIVEVISKSESAELRDECWYIRSDPVDVLCENYQYNEGHRKVTPVRKKEDLRV